MEIRAPEQNPQLAISTTDFSNYVINLNKMCSAFQSFNLYQQQNSKNAISYKHAITTTTHMRRTGLYLAI